ncbi:MAG: 4Fe-4S binding protein [Thermodesulfobacteriota bacterium]
MNKKLVFRRARQVCQIFFLALFLFLFRQTDYTGLDTIPYAVNLFFRWDPLAAAAVTLATRTVIPLLLPALAVIGLTLVFGRVFCGWICPLGTLLDGTARVIRPVSRPLRPLRHIKYVILTVVLVSAAFGLQLAGWVDPFSLLVRGMVIAVDPLFNALVTAGFDAVYFHGPGWATAVSEPVYDAFKSFILPYKQSLFIWPAVSLVMLAGVFALELLGRRFWCRNLCPLGAMLALVSRFSFFRRKPLLACKNCEACHHECRMSAFDDDRRMMAEECNLCLDCLEFCPKQITTFRFTPPVNRAPVDVTRRHLIGAGLTGITLPFLVKIDAVAKDPSRRVLRPPGALAEEDFLKTCVRCGECLKVCIQNALQPVLLEQGLDGVFTPRLVPRLGYCEFNCTLCGQVCPTGALKRLTPAEKHAFVIGRAVFDRNRCLPFASSTPCIVCEEHCPTSEKAIRFDEVVVTGAGGAALTLKRPYVITDLCVGCGICEKVCPLPGPSAVRVYPAGEISSDLYPV